MLTLANSSWDLEKTQNIFWGLIGTALGARCPYLTAGARLHQEEESEIEQSRLGSYTKADLVERQTLVQSEQLPRGKIMCILEVSCMVKA